jgi:branched-subunit amino acid ABC-type transport system permease component
MEILNADAGVLTRDNGPDVALGLDPLGSQVIVISVFFGMGCPFERVLIQPLLAKSHHEALMGSILVTLGTALAIEDLVPFVWTQSFSGIPYTVPSPVLGDVVIPTLRLAILLGI